MKLDLTPCGHLRTDSAGNPTFCSKCRPGQPALQKQLDDKQAAMLVVNSITPMMERWFQEGKISGSQMSANLMGMSVAVAMNIGMTKEQLMESITGLVEQCYAEPPKTS